MNINALNLIESTITSGLMSGSDIPGHKEFFSGNEKIGNEYHYNDGEKVNFSEDIFLGYITGAKQTPYAWTFNDEVYVCIVTDYNEGLSVSYSCKIYKGKKNEVIATGEADITTVVGENVAKQLQSSISTWYKTLRMVAIVGLLSVLVYVGIRILISSTGQDKAKYKKMLVDWVAAMCILFLLHYIMVFTMEMTEKVVSIFEGSNTELIDSDGSDKLISTVRKELKSDDNGYENVTFMDVFSYLIIYIVLVIYTCVFTWQYLKRVVMLGFLTMISPLIALTYPLDKIKDGQAQAFSMWLREYIFNALLPVIHVVLYYMLVGSAIDFIQKGNNWLYAIVAVGFMMPAEKFFRKMFGFDKASSVGQLGAAAGGAMVMNAINKIGSSGGSKSGGGSGSKDSGSKTPRTTRNIPAPGEGSGGSGGGSGGSSGGGSGGSSGGGSGGSSGGGSGGGSRGGSGGGSGGGTSNVFGEDIGPGKAKRKTKVGAGLMGVGKKYLNKPNVKKAGKWAGKKFRRALIGGAGAAALGTFGLAAGIATGDASKVLQYGGASALAGAKGANTVGDKLTEVEKQNRETFKENAWGTEEYNTRNSIKELKNDSDFMKTCENLGLDKEGTEEAIRMFHANGITNSDDIKNAMDIRAKHKNDADGPVSQEEIVAAAKMHKSLSKSYWGNPENVQKYKNSLIAKGVSDAQAKKAIRLISDFKGDLG